MRKLLPLLAALAVLFLLAWGGLWFYAENQLQAALTNSLQKYNTSQVQVSYDSLTRGTSPFAAVVTVTNLRLVIQPDAQDATPATVTLPTLALRIEADHPRRLHIDLPAQISFTTARGNYAVTFGSADYAAHLDWHALFNPGFSAVNATDATFTNVAVLASSGSLTVLTINQIGLHGRYNHKAGAHDTAIDGQENFDGIAVSPLLAKLANLPFNGTLTHFGLHFAFSGPVPANWQAEGQALNAIPATDMAGRYKFIEAIAQAWAGAGGHGSATLTLIAGPTTLAMAGTVAFDSAQQPEGTATVTANHLDAFSSDILNSYPQAQDAINTAEARLSPYLTTTNADGQLLTLNVTYGAGVVSINGQQVGTLPPLNWNYVPNPPAVPDSGAGQ